MDAVLISSRPLTVVADRQKTRIASLLVSEANTVVPEGCFVVQEIPFNQRTLYGDVTLLRSGRSVATPCTRLNHGILERLALQLH